MKVGDVVRDRGNPYGKTWKVTGVHYESVVLEDVCVTTIHRYAQDLEVVEPLEPLEDCLWCRGSGFVESGGCPMCDRLREAVRRAKEGRA